MDMDMDLVMTLIVQKCIYQHYWTLDLLTELHVQFRYIDTKHK